MSNTGCKAIGDTGGCECGVNASGGCKACGGVGTLAACTGGMVATGSLISIEATIGGCQYRDQCSAWGPVNSYPDDGCEGGKWACEIPQSCCAPGQAVECGATVSSNDILPTDVRYDGYTSCPAGMARVAGYDRDGTRYVYCRQSCSCVTPCGERPGTTLSCALQSLGYYTYDTSNSNANSCNTNIWVAYDDDDRFVSNEVVPGSCWQEQKSGWNCDDDGKCNHYYYWQTNCTYRVTCEKRATVCTCQTAGGTVTGRVFYDANNICSSATGWDQGAGAVEV